MEASGDKPPLSPAAKGRAVILGRKGRARALALWAGGGNVHAQAMWGERKENPNW